MPMKNPPHPGRSILRDCMKPLRLTVEETAPQLGISCQYLAQVINGEACVTSEMADGLGRMFGGEGDIWLRLQSSYDEAQRRNKYDSDEDQEPWQPRQEQASIPAKGGMTVYTTFEESSLRFRYLQRGRTILDRGDGYDQVEVRFGTFGGPGALQVQLVHQPRPADTPRLVADVLFKAFLVWTGDPDGRPMARVDAREWRRERAKLRAGKRLMRDLYAGLAKASSFPLYEAEEFIEVSTEKQTKVLKEAESLESNYSKVISYRAFAGV